MIKRIKDINVKCEILKVIDDNVGEYFYGLEVIRDYLIFIKYILKRK